MDRQDIVSTIYSCFKLNAVTQKDAYPLPSIYDTPDTLSGSQWFSTLDLLSRYWQVKMAEQDRPKAAFATHEGLFEFKVMLFGLCNAPTVNGSRACKCTMEPVLSISG